MGNAGNGWSMSQIIADGGGKMARPKTDRKATNVRLSRPLFEWSNETADFLGVSRNQLIEDALAAIRNLSPEQLESFLYGE